MSAVAPKVESKVLQGTAAASGGTFTVDFPIPADRVCRLEARVVLANKAASFKGASLYAEGDYKNDGGTVTALAAISGSTNPMNSSNLTGSRAQASDAAFTGAGPGPATAAFSVSGTNARLTVTNNSDTSVAADVTVFLDVKVAGAA